MRTDSNKTIKVHHVMEVNMVNKLFKMSENVVKSSILHSEYWGKGRSLSRDCSCSHNNVLKSDISDSRPIKTY